MTRAAFAVACAYLIGSVPFGLLLVRWRRGTDLRQAGSGNIGATNALRTAGAALGLLTLALDLAKGVAGVLIGAAAAGAGSLAPDSPWSAWLVLAPVVGHVFPPWLGFRGGKGVATAFGVLIAADWRLAVVAAAAFAALALPTRIVSVGSLAAAVAAAVAALWIHGLTALALGVVGVSVVIVLRHRENIARLVAGREARVASKGGER
jgi:glycerol-3-phosphate acyltransferase PlsY